MPAVINLTGQVFGRLTVICRDIVLPGQRTRWICQCQCGTTKSITTQCLQHGTKSCGCLQRESVTNRNQTHGMTGTRAYRIWQDMVKRCVNSRHVHFARYGGRGIRVIQRWRKFEGFLADMGEPPTSQHSIERVNNDGNYEPSNCVWIERRLQARNRSNNRTVVVDGVSKTLVEWVNESPFKYFTVLSRLNRGWSPKDALTAPLNTKKCSLT